MKQIEITFSDLKKAEWVANELTKDFVDFEATIVADSDGTGILTVKYQPAFLNYLCIKLFHAGQNYERKDPPQPKPVEFEGGQLNRTIELCQELHDIFVGIEDDSLSLGKAAAYKHVVEHLQYLKRLNTL